LIRSLLPDDFAAVHQAFNDAFSDYVVKMSVTAPQLREMLQRRGYVPELSVAAFEQGKIAAFVLNATDRTRAYNSGTGTSPSHRHKGLARTLMQRSAEILAEAGAKHYVLEVIENNLPAVELYRRLGFVETRRLQCWTYAENRTVEVEEIALPRSDSGAFHDVAPSWQNETASVLRASDTHVVLGDDRGYVIVFPSNGDVPQLAVHRDHRRRGVGLQLLDAAAHRAGKPLRILNVDDRDAGIRAFLQAAGAAPTVRQIEMEKTL
jgi:ribosomal protein S18 acetylase RimI-like enzyme